METLKPAFNTFKEYSMAGIVINRIVKETTIENNCPLDESGQILQIKQELYDGSEIIESSFSFVVPDSYISRIDYKTICS